jgi:hypothetical protein
VIPAHWKSGPRESNIVISVYAFYAIRPLKQKLLKAGCEMPMYLYKPIFQPDGETFLVIFNFIKSIFSPGPRGGGMSGH